MVSVLLVDDHPIVRRGIREALDAMEDIRIVGEAATGADAVRLAAALLPDVVLMDLRLPDMLGTQATSLIRSLRPETLVVMITAEADTDALMAALDAGASGYVLKDASPEEIGSSLHHAVEGKTVLPPKLAGELIEKSAPREPSTQRDLRPRMLQILRALAEGRSSKEIAEELGISSSTVEVHIDRMLLRLGARSRMEAVELARRRGLIP